MSTIPSDSHRLKLQAKMHNKRLRMSSRIPKIKLAQDCSVVWLFGSTVGRRAMLFLFAMLLISAISSESSAQWLKKGLSELKRPFIDGEPFDLIILNKNGEEAILKVKPLEERMPTMPLSDRGSVVFEMFSGFDERLEVPTSSIEKIRTFNELLLEEADVELKKKAYANALRNLLFVYDHGGKSDPELVKSLEKCMFLDATENFASKRFELALSIYEDLYALNPSMKIEGFDKKLIEIIMLCYDGIIQQKFDAEEYLSVRQNVAIVANKYPDDSTELVARWEAAFLKRSDELLEKSKRYAVDGEGRLAHLAARQAGQMVADRVEVFEHQEKLLKQFPMILVGVSDGRGNADPSQTENWGSRRVGRLTQRRMVEMVGLSDEGGKYSFLNGEITRRDDLGLEYTLEIFDRDKLGRFAVPPVNAFEVSMRLLQRAQPDSPIYHQNWAKVVDRIFIEDENRITFTLRTPFVRPEALLNMPYTDDVDVQNGAYISSGETEGIQTFELNPAYSAAENRQHPVIIEQQFNAASTAVDELLRGNIDVVDRISNADIDKLKDVPEIVVRPYVLPTVHFLVPKIRNEELKDSLNFRSGLSNIINREQIVRDAICGGKEISGTEPISGPFPIGNDRHDEISYGYDMRTKPLPYEDKLGMVLIELCLKADPPRRVEALERPSLVIIHPMSSSASNAAAAIARSWTQAGIPTETRMMKSGESVPSDEDWDFLYMEVCIEEPLADAGRLIGVHGFAKDVSAPIEQTLRILNYSRSWQTACSALRRLHRQVRVDLSIIPLWQVTEHYAYRSTVRNIGRDIIHLYQNVDRWMIDLRAEEGEDN